LLVRPNVFRRPTTQTPIIAINIKTVVGFAGFWQIRE
jgi:hypothetical protein